MNTRWNTGHISSSNQLHTFMFSCLLSPSVSQRSFKHVSDWSNLINERYCLRCCILSISIFVRTISNFLWLSVIHLTKIFYWFFNIHRNVWLFFSKTLFNRSNIRLWVSMTQDQNEEKEKVSSCIRLVTVSSHTSLSSIWVLCIRLQCNNFFSFTICRTVSIRKLILLSLCIL